MTTLILNSAHVQLPNNKIVPVNKGVIQGGILSPFLFNVYINDLLIQTDNTQGAFSFTFADDQAILSIGEKATMDALQIQSEWMKQNKINCNISKGGNFILQKRRNKH